MTDHVDTRQGVYHDSVTLLRIAQAASAAPGILAAQVAMATELNVELTIGLGFTIPEGTGPQDLLIALRGEDQAAIGAGLAAIDTALSAVEAAAHTGGGFGAVAPPRTVRAAALAAPDAAVVLLTVPGPYVIGEAMDALAAGRHVMIFSDNVPVEHEILLKETAARTGLLVMGPDCGTAIIGGLGLGFANAVQPGRVGVVAASGTGAQQLTCLLDEAGVGISHVLGLGGRDLSGPVGGRSAERALTLLDADPGTDHIVLISKPAHPATAERVLAVASGLSTPVTSVLLGAGLPDITSSVESVLGTLGRPVPHWAHWPAAGPADTTPGLLRGLFSGGTLADEAMLVAGELLGDIRSNIPLRPELGLPPSVGGRPPLAGTGHAVVDLGDDEFTRGRAHPMIDPSLRLELLHTQAADPEVATVLLDVVLGHGAEADPAGRLAPEIRQARQTAADDGRQLTVVVSLCGTSSDPQGRSAQISALTAAGAHVFLSNAAAARFAAGTALGSDRDTAHAHQYQPAKESV
ncbi:FdrA family protein [Nakamurella silvestris]|nr:FdrA family protein [Nakamurella silvestris]